MLLKDFSAISYLAKILCVSIGLWFHPLELCQQRNWSNLPPHTHSLFFQLISIQCCWSPRVGLPAKKSASKSWCTVFYSTQKPQNAAFRQPYLWCYLTSDTLSTPCLVRGVMISLRKFQRNLGFYLPCTVDKESIGASAFSPLTEDPRDDVQQLSKIWGPLTLTVALS